jgi:outer membrane protein TolC
MMTGRTITCLVLLLLAAMGLAGCKSYDGEKVRRDHVESYRQELEDKTAEALEADTPLTLDDCIRIALDNSLEVKSAEIQARIAKLDRKTAFSNFLPTVSLNYQRSYFDPEVIRSIGSFSAPMSDKRLREVTWDIQMSIFNPATWFLYGMHARGVEIADIVNDYTKQRTVLQITAGYFQCLSLAEYETALESQIGAAEAVQKELEALRSEGLISAWQADQAGVMRLARQIERDRAGRARQQAQADLLTAMGLSPLAGISLRAEASFEPVSGSLEELVSEALLCHPQLRISDRAVAIEQEAVKVAFANFLPALQGFASRVDSSDSYLKYSNYWVGGLAGTLSVFNGFANINEYKAAKQRRQGAFLRREEASLAVIVGVIKAHLNLQTAAQEQALARQNLKVADARLAEVRQKGREGLVNASELLDLLAQRDSAQMQAINAGHQYQVGAATLLNVMGKTRIDYEEPEHDGTS